MQTETTGVRKMKGTLSGIQWDNTDGGVTSVQPDMGATRRKYAAWISHLINELTNSVSLV